MTSLPILIRHINETDVPFIFNSWLKSYRHSKFGTIIRSEIYFANHHKLAEKLVARGFTLVACNKDDPSQIYGYFVGENIDGFLVINYLYVKKPFRNFGIARLLLENAGWKEGEAGLFTHFTENSRDLAEKFNFVYHPYLAFQEQEKKEEDAESKDG